MTSIAVPLQEIGYSIQILTWKVSFLYHHVGFGSYVVQVYSLKDGPAHAVWRNIGLFATILAISNKSEIAIDWLNYDGVLVNSLKARDVMLCVIICAIGSRYNSYCSNIARTFLIDANAMQSKAYAVLLKAHEAAIGALKAGNKVSVVYQAAVSVVERDAPEFASHLTKSAGTGIGLEFYTIIFNEKAAEVVTSISSKLVKDVAYSFNEEEEEEERPKVKAESNGAEAFLSKVTHTFREFTNPSLPSDQTSRSSLANKLKKSVEDEIHFLKRRVSELESDLVSKSTEVISAVSRKEEALSSVFAEIDRLKEENSVKT
ncbi:FACT complex subunit SPT16-like [Magnolia sinica]|uniref:FACT complex subunit SPT16-like n=1 Tax=Magnolia sinica TaxID=86752 RepID=UPI0026586641|nr:FACT complex subunit SPT16-like [Magnolia sinica]